MGQYSSHPILKGSIDNKQFNAAFVPNRLEFRDFVKDVKMFSLFVQALDVLYQRPFEDEFSWAALSSIHGAPFVQWGSSGDRNPPSDRPFGGYCTHGSVLFPTWHRPYVALFEQALNEVAMDLAGRYTIDRLEWLETAKTLRIPYWDWAGPIPTGEQEVPDEMTRVSIDIITPDGTKNVMNPLYWFSFPLKFPFTSFPSPHDSWRTTLRYPSSDQPDAKCRIEVLSSTYTQNRNQLRVKTYKMLTRLISWEYFSNHTAKQSPPIANSLESIHDDVHDLVGGLEPFPGHMSDTTMAAFDPVFLLHHANIDRLLSLWQAINPDVWVTPGDQPGGTYTIDDGGSVDVDTDLSPFWRTQKSHWTSATVRDWAIAFQYSYPEFAGLENASPTEVRSTILGIIDKLYGPAPSPPWQQKDGRYPIIPSPDSASSYSSDDTGVTSTESGTDQHHDEGPEEPRAGVRSLPDNAIISGYNSTTHEWTVHIRFRKFELGRSYAVHVYLGEMYVGAVSAFTSSAARKCARCRKNWDVELEGFVHLDDALLAVADVHALSPHIVKPILAEHLRIELKGHKLDGTSADIERDLPSLKIAPFSREVHLDVFYNISVLGSVSYHHDILAGKPGHTPAERW